MSVTDHNNKNKNMQNGKKKSIQNTGSVGLQNLHNTCYFNATIQCLSHAQPLTEYFLANSNTSTSISAKSDGKEYNYHKDLVRDKTSERSQFEEGQGQVAISYASLLQDYLWSGKHKIISPSSLLQTIKRIHPEFSNNRQHDPHEFCSFFMNDLSEDLNRRSNFSSRNKNSKMSSDGSHDAAKKKKKDDHYVAIESWKEYVDKHDSIIVDRFQGLLCNVIMCQSCQNTSVKFEVYSSLSLPIPTTYNIKKTSIEDCIKQFTKTEILDDNNHWYCDQCKAHVNAKKKIKIWTTPDILIFHLKRFTFEESTVVIAIDDIPKIHHVVEYPVDALDMTPFVFGPMDHSALSHYKLFGVCNHEGISANRGHYTATIRNHKDNQWYKCNDSKVHKVIGPSRGNNNGDDGSAYLLFYERKQRKAKWGGMEKFMNNYQGRHCNDYFSDLSITDEDGFTMVVDKKKTKQRKKYI